MTAYNQADSNIRKTYLLISLFFILVIALGWLFSYVFDNQAILFIAVGISFFQSIISYWYSDKIVLAITKAREVKETEFPGLYHLLENLTIASGLPMPKFYFLDEAQPNAFATGRDPNHAAIVVTRGLVEKLDKAELEGVLAHELSHIGNRDSLLMTVVVILAGLISIMANLFLRIGFRRKRSDDEGQLGVVLMVLGIVAAILAPLAASLIQLAISRKREFLADASGVLLTRYPDGLIQALEKISSDRSPMKVANTATAHLYIANPFKGEQATSWFTKLFMTHPPIEERIKALKGINL